MKILEFKIDNISGNDLLVAMQKDYWGTIQLLLELVLPQFTISEVGITHRWITHWDEQGLLGSRRDGVAWRRFSFVEYIWLRIIVRLREFQMPISTIRQVKKFLWQAIDPQKFEQFSDEFLQNVRKEVFPLPSASTHEEFEKELKKAKAQQKTVFRYLNSLFWMIFSMQLYKRPVCLLINEKGACGSIFLAGGEISEFSMNLILDTIPKSDFICINLYNILQEFFSNEKIDDSTIQKIAILGEKEKQILALIRRGDFKEITIRLKDNKEYFVGIKRNKSVDKISNEVSSIITRNRYQDIRLVTEKGKIVLAEVTEKIRI
jgi:DNA-binding transcriptional MerR regulator